MQFPILSVLIFTPLAAGLILLMLPEEKKTWIKGIALRTRQAGTRAFATVHLLVPGAWTVQHGHDWSERIEADIREAMPHVHITTHLEPKEDPVSLADQELDRRSP